MINKSKKLSKREKNKKNNRSIIIKAGIDTFLKKGISQTTVRDIIRNTDLASGTFYNYFKSKEEVLIAALDESAIEIGQELRSRRKNAKNLEEFIYSQINPFFEFARDHSELFMIMSSNLNDVKAFSVETPMMTLELESLKEDAKSLNILTCSVFDAIRIKEEILWFFPKLSYPICLYNPY